MFGARCTRQAGVLNGVICLHVDDMLGTGDETCDAKMKELDQLVGFGPMKRQKLDHCGRHHDLTESAHPETDESHETVG